MMLTVPKHIQDLQPYKPGKSIRDAAKEFGISKWIKLASNENPLGVSPKAKEAATKAIAEGHIYPHPRSPELVEALAKYLKRKENEIVCTYGVDSLLGYILMAFTREGDEVLTSEGSFIGIYVNAQKLGRVIKKIPLKNYVYDLEKIAAAVSAKTKVIYLSNPNNPTSTIYTKKTFELFLSKIPENIFIICDEAYFEYALGNPTYPNGLDYPLDRMIVTRTFSKAYGMANFRVGYGISDPKNITEILKVKLPFEPSTISVKAAAAALDDQAFLETTQRLNQESLSFFKQEFDRLKLPYVKDSFGNFLMLIFESEKTATAFSEDCLQNGLILRPLGSFGIPNGVRINSGTMNESRAAIQIIDNVIQQRKKS